MRLKDFIKTKDYIEVVESYPFAIRNLLSEAEANTITRKTGQTVNYHIDMMLTTLENVGTVNTSNVMAPMTHWKMHTESETYKWIASRACDIAKELSKKMITIDFKCIDCWGIKYEPEHFTVRHSHWPATFSFAYYIQLPKDPSPIIFPTANYEYNPNVGDLVLFPGQIQHEVKPVNGERIMISGNLVVDKWK